MSINLHLLRKKKKINKNNYGLHRSEKILQYAGISIREKEVYQFAQAEQIEQDKQENQTK